MHSDSRELMTVYEQMINESCKALTPDQIAKKAKPADNKIKDKITADSTNGDKTTKDILSKPPFTDQDPENIDQDGVDTKIKDRYVMKEGTASIQGCAVLDNQWVIEEVLVMDAESLEVLFTHLYKKLNNDRDIITNMDINSLLQHLNGVIGVLRNHTGE